jgi:hypothetical protein
MSSVMAQYWLNKAHEAIPHGYDKAIASYNN